MSLSDEFISRIDNTFDERRLEEEIETLYHILFRNRDNVEVRQEVVDKIQYISRRLNDIKIPPS